MIEGTQIDVIRELWGTVTGEINAERQRIIQDELQEAIRGVKIGMDNLSENLIQSLMSNAQTVRGSGTTIQRRDLAQIVVSCFEKPITHPSIGQILTDLQTGNNVYLYGRAGTGKTYMAKNIAEVYMRRSTEVLNCSQWTSPIQIIGGQTIEGYQQGAMIKAWREGKIFILDELPKLDPNTAGLLNDALAQSADKLKACHIFFEGKLQVGTEVNQGEIVDGEEIQKAMTTKIFCVNEFNIEYWYFVEQTNERSFITKIETLKGGDSTPILKAPEDIKNGQIVYFAPMIKDGKGDMSPKNPDFGVIGTGNTDMKEGGGGAYGGNNKQDYSLVDRFSGGYYEIEYDNATEKSLLYNKVFKISLILRKYLDDKGATESISLRTMLNFNRIYEQEMLKQLGSILAMEGWTVKTLADSVNSFIDALNPKSRGEGLRQDTDIVAQLQETPNLGLFFAEFWNKHGDMDAITGEVVGVAEMKTMADGLGISNDDLTRLTENR